MALNSSDSLKKPLIMILIVFSTRAHSLKYCSQFWLYDLPKPQVLTDQLTLYQPDSAIMPPKIIVSPLDFQIFRRSWTSHSSCCRRLAALKSVLNYSMYRVRVCNSLTFLEFLNMAKEHEISCGIFNEAKTFVKLSCI